MSERREPIFTTNLSDALPLTDVPEGKMQYSVTLDPCSLMPGRYVLAAAVTRGYVDAFDLVDNIPGFTILPVKADSDLVIDERWGYIFLRYPWSRRFLPD